MKRKTRKSEIVAGATEPKRRLTAPVGEALHRKAGSYAKAHGITIGDLVTAALEAHMRHWYFVDRNAVERNANAREPQDVAGRQDVTLCEEPDAA